MLSLIDLRDGVNFIDDLMIVGSGEYTLLVEHSDILYRELKRLDGFDGTEAVDFVLLYRISPASYTVKISLAAMYVEDNTETEFEIAPDAIEFLKDKILSYISEKLAV